MKKDGGWAPLLLAGVASCMLAACICGWIGGFLIGQQSAARRLARCAAENAVLRSELQQRSDLMGRESEDLKQEEKVAEALAAKLLSQRGAAQRLLDDCRSENSDWRIPSAASSDE